MHPLYEVMSVCSGTLQWLDQQEQDRSDWELWGELVNLGKALQEIIDSSRGSKTPEPTEEGMLFLVLCLGRVTSMTRLINRRIRENLLERSVGPRPQIDFLLNQIDELTEKVDDVMEAWELSLDADLVSKLKAAVERLDSSKTDVPCWERDT